MLGELNNEAAVEQLHEKTLHRYVMATCMATVSITKDDELHVTCCKPIGASRFELAMPQLINYMHALATPSILSMAPNCWQGSARHNMWLASYS